MNTEILLPIPSVWGCVTGAMKGARVHWIHVHNVSVQSTCRRPDTALHLPRQWCYPCHLGKKRGKGKCVPPCFPSLNSPLSYSPTQFFQSPRGNSIPKHTQEFPFLQFTNPPLLPHFKKRRKEYITLNQLALTLNNKNIEIKRLCNLWQVIKPLFHSLSSLSRSLSIKCICQIPPIPHTL